MDVLSLSSHYDKAGVSLQEEQDFGAFLRTRNPGQGIIRLMATCHPGACTPEEATFSDHVQVHADKIIYESIILTMVSVFAYGRVTLAIVVASCC